MSRQSIGQHEGKKYLRDITGPPHPGLPTPTIQVDVYSVLEAFNVTCPGRQQAIKKLLCAGLRGKGSQLDDLKGAMAALNRAIDLQEMRERSLASGEEQMEEKSQPICFPCGENGCCFAAHHNGPHSYDDPKEYE